VKLGLARKKDACRFGNERRWGGHGDGGPKMWGGGGGGGGEKKKKKSLRSFEGRKNPKSGETQYEKNWEVHRGPLKTK